MKSDNYSRGKYENDGYAYDRYNSRRLSGIGITDNEK
jgi:hypothetical protein